VRLTRCHSLPECPFDDLRWRDCCEFGSVLVGDEGDCYLRSWWRLGWYIVGVSRIFDMECKTSICKSNCIVKIEWEPGVNLQRFHKVCEALSMRDDASR